MSSTISDMLDTATDRVNTEPKWLTAYRLDQMTIFEREILSRFIETSLATTMQSLSAFITSPQDYEPSKRDATSWRELSPFMWQALEEHGRSEGRSPLQCILWHMPAWYIASQGSFERALENTAALFVAQSVLDGMERYVIEKIDLVFDEIAQRESGDA